ncbi:RNA metabolism protein [Lithospermum erythrorhizon]|uniref:RNA-dependent RNA polymerase n=1 Tax=Lithospermum erythrorhizon TaxID=34254 RepID=A0AAV3RH18_LITER
MIKVEGDPKCPIKAANSLEVVAISQKPRKAYLSKNLIALLSYGGVPEEFFQGLLMSALEETKSVFKKKRAAVRVAMNHGESDDSFTSARMLSVGIPLDEPYLQFRLCQLANEEKKKFRGGKIPISESYYLMGTSDPTDTLNSDEVCVILERGQISGKVLVYRNPCLHFGDIHVMTAKPVEAIQDVVGNAKYGIFFSTKGIKSAAAEMGNGDFDGDVYWVSQHPELLEKFNQCMPWTRALPTPPADEIKARKPGDFSPHGLEIELFRQLQDARNSSISMGVAADSWLAHMDWFLMLGDADVEQKKYLRQKILKLIDIYYDALDAPKSGKKVCVSI